MAELVHERPLRLTDAAGRVYDSILVFAQPLPGGTWEAWLEFTSEDGALTVRGPRETTQSTLDDVAYWATGLEPVFFEGALERALRRAAEAGGASLESVPARGLAKLRIETLDPLLPLDLMATRTLVPGQRRVIYNGGLIVYEGSVETPTATTPGIYDFTVQFGSDVEAAVLANKLWTALHGRGAMVEIEGMPVTVSNGAIKDALLDAVVA
jgi:hypothetical protein